MSRYTNKLLNLFGYALLYFIPSAVLSCLPSAALQWLFFLAGCGMSCFLLFKNLPQMCKFENDNIKLILFGISFTLLFMMTVSMKTKFYIA